MAKYISATFGQICKTLFLWTDFVPWVALLYLIFRSSLLKEGGSFRPSQRNHTYSFSQAKCSQCHPGARRQRPPWGAFCSPKLFLGCRNILGRDLPQCQLDRCCLPAVCCLLAPNFFFPCIIPDSTITESKTFGNHCIQTFGLLYGLFSLAGVMGEAVIWRRIVTSSKICRSMVLETVTRGGH